MAKKTNNTTQATTDNGTATTDNGTATTTAPATNGANKADAIRAFATANPNAKPSEIAKALSAQGVEVNASRVSTVLNNKRRSPGVSVDSIKLASAFVKQYGGKIAEAEEAIQKVGKFVEECGGSDEALAALASFKELSAALG